MLELADNADLKSAARKSVRVQIPPPAFEKIFGAGERVRIPNNPPVFEVNRPTTAACVFCLGCRGREP